MMKHSASSKLIFLSLGCINFFNVTLSKKTLHSLQIIHRYRHCGHHRILDKGFVGEFNSFEAI